VQHLTLFLQSLHDFSEFVVFWWEAVAFLIIPIIFLRAGSAVSLSQQILKLACFAAKFYGNGRPSKGAVSQRIY
jgi:hypothetical protein